MTLPKQKIGAAIKKASRPPSIPVLSVKKPVQVLAERPVFAKPKPSSPLDEVMVWVINHPRTFNAGLIFGTLFFLFILFVIFTHILA